MRHTFRILVVDDDPELRDALRELLSREGYTADQASGGRDALQQLNASEYDLVITDMIMPGINGIDLLKSIREGNEELPVLMLTGHSTIDDAVNAIKLGAEDYIAKPFNTVELSSIVKRLYENKMLRERTQLLQQERLRANVPQFIGESRKIRQILSEMETVAPSDAAVLITGESGTGKELVARAIHHLSKRSKEAFVAINAAAIPHALLESELFGYERGAFSGAMDKKHGLLEVANQGTLFLDEIAEMPLELQAKLLRTVQDKRIRRLGGTREIDVDIRIVSATNRNLKTEIKEKRFREDLYFRLSAFHIHVPPLRERIEDIPLLAQHYLAFRGYHQAHPPADVLKALQLYAWPGNVRELENALERAVLLSKNQNMKLKHFAAEIQDLFRKKTKQPVAQTHHPKLEAVEKEHVLKVYESCNGDKVQTAKILGIGLKTLYRKLKQYGTP